MQDDQQAHADHDAALQRLLTAIEDANQLGVGVNLENAALGKLVQQLVGPEGSRGWLEWHTELYDAVAEGLPAIVEAAQAQQRRGSLMHPAGRHLRLT